MICRIYYLINCYNFFSRFSDFMVYEIDNFKNIVHLTDFNFPKVKSVDKFDVQDIEPPKEEVFV